MAEKNIDEIKTGDFVILCTTYGVGIFGTLLGKGETVSDDIKVRRYLMMQVTEDKYDTIYDDQIAKILVLDPEDKTEYWRAFGDKYGIHTLTADGELNNESKIINDVLVNDIWDKFTNSEKDEFIQNLNLSDDVRADLINALNMGRKRNNELHNKVCELADEQIKIRQAVINFQKKFDAVRSVIPEQRWALDFIKKFLGIDELLEAM